MADEPEPIFRYRDADGREVLTNEPQNVPRALQATLSEVDQGEHIPVESFHVPDEVGGVHLPSAALGAAVVLAVVVVRRAVRVESRLVKFALVLATFATIGALYLGWVMRTAGLGDATFATPGDAVEQARQAVDQANRASGARQRAIEAIE